MVILLYHHKHGTDASICDTRKTANRIACGIIVAWWDDIRDADVRKKLRNLLEHKDYTEVVRVWEGYQLDDGDGERFEIRDDQKLHMLSDIDEAEIVAPDEDEDEEEEGDA
jgi:hypothetical protein